MTITVAEYEAVGTTRSNLLVTWESYNKAWQQGRFVEHYHRPVSLQEWWPVSDVYDFCLKLCAIYATVGISFRMELLEYLWTKWYRPGETPCRFFNFFARFVASRKPECPKTITDLMTAHRCICAQVLLRQVTGDHYRPWPPYEDHENFKLESTFLAVFIVLDTNLPPMTREAQIANPDFPAVAPALLVRTGEYHDLRSGPVDFEPIREISEEVAGNPDVRRIALGDAVDFILNLARQNDINRTGYLQQLL
ncbi:MAG: hypothetical protein Q9169_007032 [Polycauliona sp. 2 TL-2023]